MHLLKAIGNAILTLIQWLGMIYSGFCDWFGLSEWQMLFLALGIIGALLGIPKLIKYLNNKH